MYEPFHTFDNCRRTIPIIVSYRRILHTVTARTTGHSAYTVHMITHTYMSVTRNHRTFPSPGDVLGVLVHAIASQAV